MNLNEIFLFKRDVKSFIILDIQKNVYKLTNET